MYLRLFFLKLLPRQLNNRVSVDIQLESSQPMAVKFVEKPTDEIYSNCNMSRQLKRYEYQLKRHLLY